MAPILALPLLACAARTVAPPAAETPAAATDPAPVPTEAGAPDAGLPGRLLYLVSGDAPPSGDPFEGDPPYGETVVLELPSGNFVHLRDRGSPSCPVPVRAVVARSVLDVEHCWQEGRAGGLPRAEVTVRVLAPFLPWKPFQPGSGRMGSWDPAVCGTIGGRAGNGFWCEGWKALEACLVERVALWPVPSETVECAIDVTLTPLSHGGGGAGP